MTKKTHHPVQVFLKWAKGRVEAKDRGVLADLRRGFSPGTEHRCWPYIAVYCDLSKKRERIIWQTVAAGFATFEQTADSGNLGAVMRRLALDGVSGSPEDALRSFDARFRRLLTCDSAVDVCERLPGIIKAAKSKNIIPIDFEVLYKDLFYWGERVKLRWATSYWGGQKDEEDEADITTSLQEPSQPSNEQEGLQT
ncbi:type I-E CRISPR-associated protein Cse2/CasB [Desulfobacter latus]|uniref:Type I-E CRISPR-associated protein Cse2/CasB n=1 Tax=Desulfobacter latus TaxID=2292 RepID=A0A850TB27_9BACT|nr:type I-E CRISPR-associated protein Cse2/CasB [Desulfobacter latus]NWH06832.1 type I-E CRISPR-associated protein Cse2/CasB [Desulfobacter latus]